MGIRGDGDQSVRTRRLPPTVRADCSILLWSRWILHFSFRCVAMKHLDCQAQTVQHQPGRLLRNTEDSMHLLRRSAALAIAQEPDAYQPFLKRQTGVLQNSSGLCGKVPSRMMTAALPASVHKEADRAVAANRAAQAVGPALGNYA